MESAITLVKNSKEVLPLSTTKKYLHVSFGKNTRSEFLTDKMKMYIDVDSFEGDDYSLINESKAYDAIIISYHGSSSSPYASNTVSYTHLTLPTILLV